MLKFVAVLLFVSAATAAPNTTVGKIPAMVEALDHVKPLVTDLKVKLRIRAMRDDLVAASEEARPMLAKANEPLRFLADSITSATIFFKKGADTAAISKWKRSVEAVMNQEVPVSVKVPILVSIPKEGLNKVVDGNYDQILSGLIDFGKDLEVTEGQ